MSSRTEDTTGSARSACMSSLSCRDLIRLSFGTLYALSLVSPLAALPPPLLLSPSLPLPVLSLSSSSLFSAPSLLSLVLLSLVLLSLLRSLPSSPGCLCGVHRGAALAGELLANRWTFAVGESSAILLQPPLSFQ